jgi:hypothetical protein
MMEEQIKEQKASNSFYSDKIFAAHILLYGSLASEFGYDLLDQTFDNPTREATVKKLVLTLKNHFFDFEGKLTRGAIVKVLRLLLEHCFVNKKQEKSGKPASQVIMAPLYEAIINGDRV